MTVAPERIGTSARLGLLKAVDTLAKPVAMWARMTEKLYDYWSLRMQYLLMKRKGRYVNNLGRVSSPGAIFNARIFEREQGDQEECRLK